MRQQNAAKIFQYMAAAIALALSSSCSSPIKPAVLDASGPKIRHVVIGANFVNSAGNPKLNSGSLTSELVPAFEAEAAKISAGSLTVSKPASDSLAPEALASSVPTATHVMVVEADLASKSYVTRGYYNSCQYTTKEGKCVGGMTADTTTSATVKMRMQVVDARTGRTVFRSDDATSRPVSVDDSSSKSTARGVAAAGLKALKESGLL